MSNELTAILICDKMSWTYEQYLDSPLWFIKGILVKMSVENDYAKKQNKK